MKKPLSKLNPLVVLCSPPSRSINHYRPPVALLYLAGYLKQHSIKAKIVDITLNEVVKNKKFFKNIDQQIEAIESKIIHQITQLKPMVVGITCYTPEYMQVLSLAHKIKAIFPKTKIIIGGIHPTLYPDEMLLEPKSPIDYEVVGEGEETLLELSKYIIKKTGKLSSIKGIAYLSKSKVVKNNLRPLNSDLDYISHPAYDLIDMNYYTNASPYAIRGCFLRSIYILATRGCPSTCTFCVAKKLRAFNGGGQYTRVRSAKSLIKEIKTLKSKYQIDSFYFIDDLFTINKANVINFCRELKKQKLNLLWGCSSKVSTLNKEIIQEMASAGCVQIDFGVERGSNQSLIDIQKGISTQMITEIFNLCHLYKIRTFANFLVNLPGETKKDLNDIIKFSQTLKSEIYSYNVFTPYPGTDIYDNMTYCFTKDEYQELFSASDLIETFPIKYKFHKHNINILNWATIQNRRFNELIPNIKFHLSLKYISMFFNSSNKLNYISQSVNLFREVLNQKFNLNL
ncbi:MAG: radical SAM protein [Candidatus Shapirobacteria bacterium]